MIPLVRFRWVMAFPHLHPFWPAIFLKHRIFNNFIVENVLVGTHAMPVPFPGSAAKKQLHPFRAALFRNVCRLSTRKQ
jgi:hypothetical protein